MRLIYILTISILSWNALAQKCPTASGDEVTYGDGDAATDAGWIGYVYNAPDNFDTGNYQGFITEPVVFNDVFCSGDCNITAASACTVDANSFSVRFKMRKAFSCDFYTFTIGGDDGARLSLDGGNTFVIDDYESHPYRLTPPYTVFLEGTYDLVLEYYESGSENRVSFNVEASNASLGNLTEGGVIGTDQDVCDVTNYNPEPLTSISIPSVCPQSNLLYQWESSDDNLTFSEISGATGINYDPPTTTFKTTYYRRRVNFGAQTAYSNTVSVNSGQTTGDGIVYGDGDAALNPGWIGYIYGGRDNFTNDYLGFITEDIIFTENFSSNDQFVTDGGCSFEANNFSVRFKMRKTFNCELYTITIGSDDGARLSIDGGVTYVIDDYQAHGYREVSRSLLLEGTYDLVLDYYEGSGGETVSFQYTASGNSLDILTEGGSIGESQSACGFTSFDPVRLENISVPNVCPQAGISYQWEISSDNVLFDEVSGATEDSYDPPANSEATVYYRRKATFGSDVAYSNTLSINYGLLTGDQTSYGNGNDATTPGWIGYIYDGTNNYRGTDYKGFIREDINFDESFCGNNCNFSTDGGCGINSESFSVRFKMNIDLPCDTYTFTIGGDNGVRLSLDGGSTYVINDYSSHDTYRTATPYVVLLDGSYDLVLEYYEDSGENRVSFDMVASGTPPLSLEDGGTIEGDQSKCSSLAFDPKTITSVFTPAVCPQSGLSYQWESSTDNIVFSDLPGENGMDYDPPLTTVPVTYYRRRANFNGQSAYSNTITVNYGAISGDMVTYGDGDTDTTPDWIGYVYDGGDNYQEKDYLGFITESVNFDEPFGSTGGSFNTDGGCTVSNETYTVQYRMRKTFSCNFYTFTIGADDGVRLSLDGGKTYIIDDYSNHAYRETEPFEVLLDGVYNIILEYYQNYGGSRVTFDYFFSDTPQTTLTEGGEIIAAPGACEGGSLTPEINNKRVPNLCPQSALTYQWEISEDAENFVDIDNAISISYTPEVAANGVVRYYRRKALFGNQVAYSDTVSINFGERSGDPSVFGDGDALTDPGWIGYIYEGIDDFETENYRGFIKKDVVFEESFCGENCSFVTSGGCYVDVENMSARFLMKKDFAPGVYRFTLQSENSVKLSLDGGMTFPIDASSIKSRTFNFETELGGEYNMVIEYFEDNGITNGLNFNVEFVAPLPITLIYFSGKYENGKNTITWRTSTEVNNDYFILEKSRNGEGFAPLAEVIGAGNSSVEQQYQVIDDSPYGGNTYYRLKQVDFNGTYEYSNVLAVTSGDSQFEVYYDNKTKHFSLLIEGKGLNDIQFELMTVAGQIVFNTRFTQANSENSEFSFRPDKYLTNGLYVVRVHTSSQFFTKKILIVD